MFITLQTHTVLTREIVWSVHCVHINEYDAYINLKGRQVWVAAQKKNKFDIYDVIYYIPKCWRFCSSTHLLVFFFCSLFVYEYLIYDGFMIKDVLSYTECIMILEKKTTIMSFVRQHKKKFRLVIYGARASLHSSYE